MAHSSSWVFTSACRTIQKYLRNARLPRRGGQPWATFLQNHAKGMWACDAHTSHRPLLSVAGRFSSFSMYILEKSSMWVSHALLPMPGLPVPLREATPSCATGQCDLRTSDRHPSSRVPGLADSPVRVAFTVHLAIVDSPLQRRTSAHGARSRSSRSAARHS